MIDVLKLLETQRNLQVTSFGLDPLQLEGAERTRFIEWNVTALTDELHELLGEVGWKPWASSRHVNEKEAMGELVDAMHFFLNLVLAVAPRETDPKIAAHSLVSGYSAKVAVNARRQAEGYDGVTGKCKTCKRDLKEVEPVLLPYEGDIVECCPCGTPIPEDAP